MRLTLAGQKRGTAHLTSDFETNEIASRQAGDYWIVLNASGDPVCLVRLTRVDVQPFNQVGLEFAASEGEGDLSLEYWRQAHRDYFDKFCAKFGLDWQEDSPVVCESFELIHP